MGDISSHRKKQYQKKEIALKIAGNQAQKQNKTKNKQNKTKSSGTISVTFMYDSKLA